MSKMFLGWCPVCDKKKTLTTMDKPIGSACRCTSCGSGLSVSGKNQILTLPFFLFVIYLVVALPMQGRAPNSIEVGIGFITLILFTLYQKRFICYTLMEK